MASELEAMLWDYKFPVNSEIRQDVLEEEHGPLNERSRLCSCGTSLSPMQPSNHNHLHDEPSPFGEPRGVMKNPSNLYESVLMQRYQSGYSKSVNAPNSGLMNYPEESSRPWMAMRKSLLGFRPASSELAATCGFEFPPVNSEAAHGPLNNPSMLWSSGTSSSSPMQPTNYNLRNESSPLVQRPSFTQSGPSLYEPIQMHELYDSTGYSKAVTATASGLKKESKRITTTASIGATMKPKSNEKLKASNFPATLLKIGQWKYESRDVAAGLVAKFYFAKRKLVWEVMKEGLKSKMEIEWSDITALKTNCPEHGPGTLTLVLAKQPLFFRETKATPGKQTMWQKTTDFTNGQASTNRQHFLQCAEGIMNKHIEKLLQFDHRLFNLSQQPENIVMNNPYFDERKSNFEDQSDESKGHHPFGNLNRPSISGTQNLPASPFGTHQSSSSKHMYLSHIATPSPNSVIDARANQGIWSAQTVNSRNAMDCVQNEEQYSMAPTSGLNTPIFVKLSDSRDIPYSSR